MKRHDSSAAEDFRRLKITRRSAVLVVAWHQMTSLRTKAGCGRKLWRLLLSAFIRIRRYKTDQPIGVLYGTWPPPKGASEP